MSFTDEQIAQVAHEANRALQKILGNPSIPVAPPWDQFSEEQREGVIAGVRIARHGAPPRVLHDAWVQGKLTAGWTHGETKDAEAKTHPLLVDFDSMPPEEQAKDFLLSGICTALGAAANVITRTENERLALEEAEQLVRTGAGNAALQPGAAPFGGLPPVIANLAAAGPQPPAQPDTAEE